MRLSVSGVCVMRGKPTLTSNNMYVINKMLPRRNLFAHTHASLTAFAFIASRLFEKRLFN